MVWESLAIRQFRQDDCLSYIIFDRLSLQAMVVDPRLDLMDEYREFLGQSGCRVVYSLDTRLQADHLSAADSFRSEKGCELLLSSQTKSRRQARKLGDGEVFSLGNHGFQALHAPGVAEDGLILKSDRWLLTGDALWVGSSENSELPNVDLKSLWEVTHRVSKMFPKETLVYAGHDRTGILFSTLEVELHKNPILTAPSLQAFVEAIPPARGMRVTKYDQESLDRMRFNQADSQESGDFQELRSSSWQSNRPISVPGGGFGSRNDSVGCGTSSINVEKFSKKLAERASGVEFLDVREPSEFDSGHIPGMRNVALSDLGDEVPRLRSAKRVYLSCLSGIRSTLAAKTLAYIGVKDVVVVNGGFQAWNHAGFSVEEKSS